MQSGFAGIPAATGVRNLLVLSVPIWIGTKAPFPYSHAVFSRKSIDWGYLFVWGGRPAARDLHRDLHYVVASGLPSIDVKNLTRHKPGTIKIEHRVDNVGHLSHPTHWMERRQRLMRFGRVHWRLDYSR
jgi:hypothetical protein